MLQFIGAVGSIKTDLSYLIPDKSVRRKGRGRYIATKRYSLHKALFDLSLEIKHLLHTQPSSSSMLENESRMNFLGIGVPMFDGNILHWTMFREQFEVFINSKTQLTNVENLAYLSHALKGRPAIQA